MLEPFFSDIGINFNGKSYLKVMKLLALVSNLTVLLVKKITTSSHSKITILCVTIISIIGIDEVAIYC